MKKIILGLLVASSYIFIAQDASFSKDDQRCCKLLNEAALRAEIMLLCKYDDDFPKRRTHSSLQGDIPASFTKEKAVQCLHCSFLKHNPAISIIASDKNIQGSITVQLERVDFDAIMAMNYDARCTQYKESQAAFEFYQLGNQ